MISWWEQLANNNVHFVFDRLSKSSLYYMNIQILLLVGEAEPSRFFNTAFVAFASYIQVASRL